MSEFSIINQYCRDLGKKQTHTRIGVGDDGAVLAIPPGKQLVVSVDTMVEGIHFFADVDPEKLAHKLVAVNASDIAAMGGVAAWATLALTVPHPDDAWLTSFSVGLGRAAEYFGVELVGGDTTRGPLTLSLQIMGLVDEGEALCRSNANVGDQVMVTGTLGDAALALSLLNDGKIPSTTLMNALELPQPPILFAASLVGLASCAIDISDGLIADLAHVAKASDVCLDIESNSVPRSYEFKQAGGTLEHSLYGGDDYQLAFTVSPTLLAEVSSRAQRYNASVTHIGKVISKKEQLVRLRGAEGNVIELDASGYDHFQA